MFFFYKLLLLNLSVDGYRNFLSAVGAMNKVFSRGISDSATLSLGFPAGQNTEFTVVRKEGKCVGRMLARYSQNSVNTHCSEYCEIRKHNFTSSHGLNTKSKHAFRPLNKKDYRDRFSSNQK